MRGLFFSEFKNAKTSGIEPRPLRKSCTGKKANSYCILNMSSFKVIIQKNCCSICLDFAAKKVTFSDSGKISPSLVRNERRESGQKIRPAPVRKNILRVCATPGPDLRAGVQRHVRLPSQRLRAGAGAVKVSQERAKNLLVPNAWLRAFTAILCKML